MGMTLKEVLFGIGGGIKNDRQFKAVQMGGPSGGCIPASLIVRDAGGDSRLYRAPLHAGQDQASVAVGAVGAGNHRVQAAGDQG